MLKRISLLFLAVCLSAGIAMGQSAELPANWFNLDPQADNSFGVSTEKAYSEVLKSKKSKTVIVAVLDGGTEVAHEDLKDIIWVNEDEVAGNGIDDDKNGYIDDVNGWSFIGGPNGDVKEDTYEKIRVYNKLRAKYKTMSAAAVPKEQKDEYAQYVKLRDGIAKEREEMQRITFMYTNILNSVEEIEAKLGADKLTEADLKSYKITNIFDSLAIVNMVAFQKQPMGVEGLKDMLKKTAEYQQGMLDYKLNPEFDPRSVVGDNYEDVNERYYGNNNVTGPEAMHGTHVAGIIAAVRNNNLGINGVANDVRIMVVRVVPDGDERDKDVANAIRYAVDNGATIINMSFGKDYSPEKAAVDAAVKYAVSKDVLLVHGAGNEARNMDKGTNYPNPVYADGGVAESWIQVGAISAMENEYLAAPFSNYGKKGVDIFAPGVDIKSTVPGSEYEPQSGTSMASPVVAGVAAVLRSYYPELSAVQIKEILMETVTPVDTKVYIPGTKKTTKFKKLCKSAGVVNLYNAVQMAEQLSSGSQSASSN